MKVKANERLFDEIKGIAYRLELLDAIVQNDTEITEERLNEFIAKIDEITQDIYRWGSKVVGHIVNCNKED